MTDMTLAKWIREITNVKLNDEKSEKLQQIINKLRTLDESEQVETVYNLDESDLTLIIWYYINRKQQYIKQERFNSNIMDAPGPETFGINSLQDAIQFGDSECEEPPAKRTRVSND